MTLHTMTRQEMKAEQKRLKALTRAIYQDHIISGCQCCSSEYNPFDMEFRVCETMEIHTQYNRRMRTIRNFRMVRFCEEWEINPGMFTDRFAGIWGVVA